MPIFCVFHHRPPRTPRTPRTPPTTLAWWDLLPDDVLGVIAAFLSATAWKEETHLFWVLNVLKASPRVIAENLKQQRDLYAPHERVHVGMVSFGHGYGELRTVAFVRNDTFLLDGVEFRARCGDILSRCTVSGMVSHNSTFLDSSSQTVISVRSSSITVSVMETTPGW
tara:strand:+ start:3111 stop:3614 length:504 start_codon:yes stop_codon:yes gene_type:complete